MKEMEKRRGASLAPRRVLSLFLGFLILLLPAIARGLEYPTRPVQVVVGTAAGGPADAAARILSEELTKELKNPVIVFNKPGASGTIATSFVAGAKPDGYTVLVGMTMSLSAGFPLIPDISYKLSDFAPIARHIIFPLVVAVRSEAPWKTLKDFLEDAKKNPKYKSGSDGGGTALAWDAILKPLNMDVVHIMFNGSAPNFTALLGGHIDISATVLTPLLPQLEAKQVRLLATSSKLDKYPDVPTIAQLGYPDAARDFWNGFLAPANTPKPIIEKLSETIRKILNDPAVNAKLAKIGVIPSYQGPNEFGKYLQTEYEIFTALGKKYKLE
ncbi:MAG TPA: tripartite tricarboxylate transporter substrate binding protein [Thermodesulfobacteriota bacterium]|nr:tripartite tricarboxylate transporter substrate binding protein [Thermodesulfobacteriota bacterium]